MKSNTIPTLGVVATLIATSQAGLRFPCSTLTAQRLDPAAEPGALPSAHLHMIVGGNAFNATMYVFLYHSGCDRGIEVGKLTY